MCSILKKFSKMNMCIRHFSPLLKKRTKSPHGFTTMEIIIVLAIIAAILGLTTVYLFNFKSASGLKLAADEIAGVLNQARSLAITSQGKHKVVFDEGGNSYTLTDASGNTISSHNLKNGIIFYHPSKPNGPVTFNADTAVFNSSGGAIAGSVYLRSSQGKYYTVTVVSATGRVRIFNYRKD